MRLFWLTLLAAALLSGCSGVPAGTLNTENAAAGQAGQEQDIHFNPQLGKYDPQVDLYTVGAINPDIKFINGENLEHNVHTRWAEERLGIRLNYLWTVPDSNKAYDNKLRLEMAKGNMPDVVAVRNREIAQELIDSGQFMEVGGLFERMASPVWKAAMAEDKSAWDFYERDGGKYAIPILDYEYTADPLLWIRVDWLKKLGLPLPTTLDELETVMKAFTRDDPDGNGQNDTYGLSFAFRNGLSTWMGDLSWLFGAFGEVPDQWNRQADGSLAFGSVAPSTAQGLTLLKNWVAQGYVSRDSEWFDEEHAAALFTDGKAGIIAGPYWMNGWPLSNLKAKDPTAEFEAIGIPSGPGGTVLRRGTLPVNGAILINKQMKHPEIFFTYQNYLFDYYATSTGEFANGLAKGYDWTEVDGEPTILPEYLPQGGIRVASYTLTFDGARIPSKVIDAIPATILPVLFSQKETSVKEQFTGPPTATMRTSWELLQKLKQKTFQKIIFADSPVSDFSAFTEKWRGYGGTQITREVNEWDREQHGGR